MGANKTKLNKNVLDQLVLRTGRKEENRRADRQYARCFDMI